LIINYSGLGRFLRYMYITAATATPPATETTMIVIMMPGSRPAVPFTKVTDLDASFPIISFA